MKILQLKFQGLFANQLITYCWARTFAARHAAELQTDTWIGQTLFPAVTPNVIVGGHDYEISGVTDPDLDAVDRADVVRVNNFMTPIRDGKHIMDFSKADARKWLTFRPEFTFDSPYEKVYQRRFFNPVTDHFGGVAATNISLRSYEVGIEYFGYKWSDFEEISQRNPHNALVAPPIEQLNLLTDGNNCKSNWEANSGLYVDFQILTQAKVLFRANSSYGWLAAVLGDGEVYSPNMAGVAGGIEPQFVRFEKGNHGSFWQGNRYNQTEPSE